jgi:hypothetical protein
MYKRQVLANIYEHIISSGRGGQKVLSYLQKNLPLQLVKTCLGFYGRTYN